LISAKRIGHLPIAAMPGGGWAAFDGRHGSMKPE